MGVCWPATHRGEGTHSIFPRFAFILIHISRAGTFDRPRLLVWDILTGVVVSDIGNPSTREIGFSGDRRIVSLLGNYFGGYSFCAYDAPEGTRLRDEGLTRWPDHQLGAHWPCKDNLRFATSSMAGGERVIEIHELQQILDSPLLLVESFSIPDYHGTFSFSPVSFHASFVTGTGIVVLDVRTSKLLLQTRVARTDLSPPGWFSPDGQLFACGTSQYDICVWQNTSAGYTPWNNFCSRLPFKGFLSSPTSSSMLTWGLTWVQLLHPNSYPGPPDSNPIHRQRGYHLVARFADCARIATTRIGSGVVTVLDCPLGTLRQSIDTRMKILDIKIVDDTVVVVDISMLARWDPQTGRRVHGARSVPTDEVAVDNSAVYLTLSRDCSQVAFIEASQRGTGLGVRLRGVEPPGAIASLGPRHSENVVDIRFSLDQRELWLLNSVKVLSLSSFHVMKLGVGGSGGRRKVTTETLEGTWSWVHLFSFGYHIGTDARWIKDTRGTKILWLPPTWRSVRGLDVRWDGNFLALIASNHPVPIIIEFQS